MKDNSPVPYENREISWLSFNERVLQEAGSKEVPLLERIKFLAIYSSNLDEFFRVRMASLRSLTRLNNKSVKQLGFNPARLITRITQIVTRQQEMFGEIMRSQILPALAEEGMHLLQEKQLTEEQKRYLEQYFDEEVKEYITPISLSRTKKELFLKNKVIYMVTELWDIKRDDPDYVLIELPSPPLNRFVTVPSPEGQLHVLFLDDVIRLNLPRLLKRTEIGTTYAVKVSRDAELYLEDEFSGDLVEMIRKSLGKRDTGLPTRFLYDLNTPFALAATLKKKLNLAADDMVLGGRYHNLHDFFSFPGLPRPDLSDPELKPLAYSTFDKNDSLFTVLRRRDHLLHFPYQSFAYVIRFIEEAAEDPAVTSLKISLYRVASDSAVANALIRAVKNGKEVMAFVEVKARFDEASNITWADRMEKAGVQVVYSLPGLKVHAKIALITRMEKKGPKRYAYLGTGNFNEKTALVYADAGLLTSDDRLTSDLVKVFDYLNGSLKKPAFQHLLVAPFSMRKQFVTLIKNEMQNAKEGKKAALVVKLNSLEDPKMIGWLYKASQAGVQVQIIVRGICCLVPGIEGVSEHIEVISIVDRFLEHARIYTFHNDGDELIFLASADWMKRNLSRRIEVGFPIYNTSIKKEIKAMLRFQLTDNRKARIVDRDQSNPRVARKGKAKRAQLDFYNWLERRHNQT